MQPQSLLSYRGITAEVIERVQIYLDLLLEWRERMNLVGRSTLLDPWRRHILDSVQIFPLLPPGTKMVFDIGSGAGFPGLVLALMADATMSPYVKLIESDARKCSFLRQVISATGARASVINVRAENMTRQPAEVVTARAVAPLPKLLEFATPLLGDRTVCLFLKGAKVEDELTQATRTWHMHVTRVASLSEPTGSVLKLQGIARRARR